LSPHAISGHLGNGGLYKLKKKEDLYKLEKSKSQTRTVIQNKVPSGNGDASAVRALLEEQKRQRELEGSLELMKRGLEMMNGPKPKLTCKYNTLTKTTVCN
jgi:hypothetical protein